VSGIRTARSLSTIATKGFSSQEIDGLLREAVFFECTRSLREDYPAAATIFLWLAQKMRQALTFSATIQNDVQSMKTLAVILILALLTLSGAAISDQLLTGDQRTARAN
jgi:hypothetical protein